MDESSQGSQEETDAPRPRIEWAVGFVSLALVAALVVFLVYEAVFGGGRPADPVVTVEGVRDTAEATAIDISVVNRGDEAAAALSVVACVDGLSRRIEFDYLAAHAERRGTFMFPPGTAQNDVVFGIGGFSEP